MAANAANAASFDCAQAASKIDKQICASPRHVVTQALGPDVVGDIAAKLGLGHGDAAGGIAQVLPELIDKLTPHGQAPQGGLGSTDDIVGMLGRMLQQR